MSCGPGRTQESNERPLHVNCCAFQLPFKPPARRPDSARLGRPHLRLHHHPYELPPTAEELEGWLDAVEAVITEFTSGIDVGTGRLGDDPAACCPSCWRGSGCGTLKRPLN